MQILDSHLNRDHLEVIFKEAAAFEKSPYIVTGAQRIILATVFYEPSTRTRLSFEAAMLRLGGNTISIPDAKHCSAEKGETLEDTVRTVSQYSDILVLRHSLPGAAKLAQEFSECPIINAGDGSKEHPTQAILDLFTIQKHFKKIDGLKILISGDLMFGRTVHSLLNLLENYEVEIWVDSPKELKLRGNWTIHECATTVGSPHPPAAEILKQVDVAYMTRMQKERWPVGMTQKPPYFSINKNNVDTMKEDAIIMHPLPRNDEINISVDKNKRAKYFEQAKNGLYVRMALIKMVLGL